MAPIVMQDELIDDSIIDVPVAGLKGTLSLRERFKYRLGRMLGRTVAVLENKNTTINIYIGPAEGSIPVYVERTRKFIEDLQCALRDIASSTDEPQRDEASRDQWDMILIHVSQTTEDIIKNIQSTFQKYNNWFDAVVTQVFGVDDVEERGSSLDTDLGDRVIRLQQLVHGYDGSIKQQNGLIEFAWSLVHHCLALNVRLKCLLGSRFSNELYNHICQLSHPLSTHHSFVRAAVTFKVFRTVAIHLGSPPAPSPKAIGITPIAASAVQQPQSLQLCKAASPTRNSARPHGNIMDTIRPYLPEEDRGLSLFRLQPAAKQSAALLIGCVLHDTPVPPGSDTYYLFGFVTCRTKEQEDNLSDYYRQLLKTTVDKIVIFTSLAKALELNTLPGLLHHSCLQMKKSHPSLLKFLGTAPEERLSVFRLIQFVRDTDNDEPLPCLKRDYGFRFCTQREHVAKLKALYARVIVKTDPMELHSACTHGRLLHFAIKILGWVDVSMRRLLQNDYPHPAVGLDNTQSLELYMMPLFKKSLKGNMAAQLWYDCPHSFLSTT